MKKFIAIIAHDDKKQDMTEWVGWNAEFLSKFDLVCTGATGSLVEKTIKSKGIHDFKLTKMASGPSGGDQQIGSMIVEGKIGALIFYWDPMSSHPHDPDVRALLRLAVLYDIPTACNRKTADMMISSELFEDQFSL